MNMSVFLILAGNLGGPIFLAVAVHSHTGSLVDSVAAALCMFALIPYRPRP
jgi:hypothetical protein